MISTVNKNRTFVARLGILSCLIVSSMLGMSGILFANTGSQWQEMVRACEAVISSQNFAPLEQYESAPFTHGLPGVKVYSVYNRPQTLVAIARVDQGKWVNCLVRESEETRSGWREVAAEWESGFEVGFPRDEYQWVIWRYHPARPFRGAVRCCREGPAILITPNLETNFYFRVEVSSEIPQGSNPCGGNSD
ncbi:hypothetical protein [Profundibacter amoris]|uniref:hypothetical protein n=1 Tax=Profundibacter amoris TaxID=2171755 RepID=UPI0013C30E8D|nr:hypothetical protein [Profundibacter amoris]